MPAPVTPPEPEPRSGPARDPAIQSEPRPQPEPVFYYRDGIAVLRHVREAPPWMAYDARAGGYVAPGHRLPEVRAWAEARGIGEAGGPDALDRPVFDPRRPRDYQREALARWLAAGGRGTVVLPTGAGKSLVAVLAVAEGGRGACVVAPTRALVAQWYGQLVDAFGADAVGAFYGDEKDPRPITVTTYHSAFRLLEQRGHRFELLVLDEAHHLADAADGGDRAWHDALRIAPAARRLGLTATYPDGADRTLRELVGPVVYRRVIGEMADAELADFALERRFVRLTPEEQALYDECGARYAAFIAGRDYAGFVAALRERGSGPAAPRGSRRAAGVPETSDWWPLFMAETRRRPAARRAFAAFRERERIVALAERKLAEAERLLRLFPAEQAILFCGSTAAAELLSRRLAVPMISAQTPASERKAVLDDVARGAIRAVAAVRVLDEGWDVPSAKLGIVLGDTTRGGRRQHAQRLGRLLRRQGDAVASLFEIVAAETHEFFASQKRGAAVRRARAGQFELGF